ncbi:MAG: hypothetical protein HQL05_04710 [Nitrospirae bacterium]|nr:hypothetical protein [Nitrospirota bacterium]
MPRKPLCDLCPLSSVQHINTHALGAEKAKHRLRRWQVHCQQVIKDRHRTADVKIRRRRTC